MVVDYDSVLSKCYSAINDETSFEKWDVKFWIWKEWVICTEPDPVQSDVNWKNLKNTPTTWSYQMITTT